MSKQENRGGEQSSKNKAQNIAEAWGRSRDEAANLLDVFLAKPRWPIRMRRTEARRENNDQMCVARSVARHPVRVRHPVYGGTMTYKISDEQFLEELRVNAFINQVQGEPIGRRRMDFKPILVTFPEAGAINRYHTVNAMAYTFTDEEKALLLELLPNGSCTAETK